MDTCKAPGPCRAEIPAHRTFCDRCWTTRRGAIYAQQIGRRGAESRRRSSLYSAQQRDLQLLREWIQASQPRFEPIPWPAPALLTQNRTTEAPQP